MTRDDARRGNLREHGKPDHGVYFRRDPKRPTGDGVLVRIAREARAIRLRDTAGNTVAAFGDTTKFWLAPAPSEPSPAAGPAGEAATSPSVPAERIRPPQATVSAEQVATVRTGLTAAVPAVDEGRAARPAELATSYRLTAQAITAAGTVPVPIRQTWAAAGSPEVFLYYERDVRPGRPILATTADGYRIHDTRTGQLIAHYASPVRMWIAPAPVPVAPAPMPVIDGAGGIGDQLARTKAISPRAADGIHLEHGGKPSPGSKSSTGPPATRSPALPWNGGRPKIRPSPRRSGRCWRSPRACAPTRRFGRYSRTSPSRSTRPGGVGVRSRSCRWLRRRQPCTPSSASRVVILAYTCARRGARRR